MKDHSVLVLTCFQFNQLLRNISLGDCSGNKRKMVKNLYHYTTNYLVRQGSAKFVRMCGRKIIKHRRFTIRINSG